MPKKPPRVYEFIGKDGTVFWSFTQSKATVTPPQRLIALDKVGQPLMAFIKYLQQEARKFGIVEEDVEEEPKPGVE